MKFEVPLHLIYPDVPEPGIGGHGGRHGQYDRQLRWPAVRCDGVDQMLPQIFVKLFIYFMYDII